MSDYLSSRPLPALTYPTAILIEKLRKLDELLLELLESLTPEEWQAQTVARLWKVKDVAAHLLDGNIRILSSLRDEYQGENPDIRSYQDLLDFLNGLNADWVKAMKRVSPQVLILLHRITGPMYCDYYASLDPQAKATFSVAWAGEEESQNGMHIAREYTEKWLHQQQIRAAVHKPGLLTQEFFHPFIDIFMYGLPHTYRNVQASEGTTLKVTIITQAGGSWYLIRRPDYWQLERDPQPHWNTEVTLTPEVAWPLFSKSVRPHQLNSGVGITGDEALGKVALEMVSVMA